MRLDKLLSEMNFGSRKDVKDIIKKGNVSVNDAIVKNPNLKIDEETDEIKVYGERIHYQKFHYYLLNKPKGVLSATTDKHEKTVLDLIKPEDRVKGLFPVGRLDKDTVGLLLLTNDGVLAHRLLSPKQHVEKEYFARIEGIPSKKTIKTFKEGVDLGNNETALPAHLEIAKVHEKKKQADIFITIHEGKYHQVKRMFQAVGLKVIFLERVRMDQLLLDHTLSRGEYRQLTEDELSTLLKRKK